MLSRTAENLFWAARYIERADSLARLLEVGYRISLVPNTETGHKNEWESILETSGIKEFYLQNYEKISKDKIILFLLSDPDNASSIKNCIKNARENIRMVRTAVTLEVWNAINTSFHNLEKNFQQSKNLLKELPEIIEWVKKQVNLIRGTILNTQLINDGYDFLILGTYFERADFTARIINVKYFILLPSVNYVGSEVDNFQWSMMLRSISSYRAFKWAYGQEDINYIKIIDFLILNMTCPRSLVFSVEKINHHLERLCKLYKQDSIAKSRVAKMYKRLQRFNAEQVSDFGLHEFLRTFIKDINLIYNHIEKKYFFGTEE